MRPLPKSRPHLVATGSQAGVSLPGMPVPEMFPDRRTAASDGRAGKSPLSDNLRIFEAICVFTVVEIAPRIEKELISRT